MSSQTIERATRRLLRHVGKLPHWHPARAVFFRIAGSPRGIVTADDVTAIVSAIFNR